MKLKIFLLHDSKDALLENFTNIYIETHRRMFIATL
jgi:hypothetical protein